MEIFAKSCIDAYKQCLQLVLDKGITVNRRVGDWNLQKNGYQNIRELHNVTTVITDPLKRYSSVLHKGVVVETLDMMLGLNSGFVHNVLSLYRRWLKGEEHFYSYGSRLFGGKDELDQIEYIINMLKQDKTSRHAVGMIRRPIDLTSMYQACSIFCSSQIDDSDKLEFNWVMRSQDCTPGGKLRNYYMNSHLHEYISNHTGLELGNYIHTDLNVHIYESDLDKVDSWLQIEEPDIEPSSAGLLTTTDRSWIYDILWKHFKLETEINVKMFEKIQNLYYRSLVAYVVGNKKYQTIPELQWLSDRKV